MNIPLPLLLAGLSQLNNIVRETLNTIGIKRRIKMRSQWVPMTDDDVDWVNNPTKIPKKS